SGFRASERLGWRRRSARQISEADEPAGTQQRETPTARLALASSLLHLNPGYGGGAWLIVARPVERIGAPSSRWNHPRDSSLCRSYSGPLGELSDGRVGRQPARFIRGSTCTVPHQRLSYYS